MHYLRMMFYIIILTALVEDRVCKMKIEEDDRQKTEIIRQQKQIVADMIEQEKRDRDKAAIEKYRRNQAEIEGLTRFGLEAELRKKVLNQKYNLVMY